MGDFACVMTRIAAGITYAATAYAAVFVPVLCWHGHQAHAIAAVAAVAILLVVRKICS